MKLTTTDARSLCSTSAGDVAPADRVWRKNCAHDPGCCGLRTGAGCHPPRRRRAGCRPPPRAGLGRRHDALQSDGHAAVNADAGRRDVHADSMNAGVGRRRGRADSIVGVGRRVAPADSRADAPQRNVNVNSFAGVDRRRGHANGLTAVGHGTARRRGAGLVTFRRPGRAGPSRSARP